MRRRGFTMIELAAAMLVVSVLMLVAMQMLAGLSAEKRMLECWQIAQLELGNQMELFTAAGWDGVTQEAAKKLTLSETAQRRLPAAKLLVEVAVTIDKQAGRRISMRLDWRDRSGQRVRPVRLAAWIYQMRGDGQ